MAIKNFICKGYYHKNKNYITLDFTNMLNNGKNCSWFPGTDVDDENSVTVLKIQEYESGSSIYLVLNKGNETESKEKIYENFLGGKYLIGNFNWFSDPHLIFNIKSYNDINVNDEDDDYSEIKLHYTEPRNYTDANGYKINHAWRTITWDLFDEFVNKD